MDKTIQDNLSKAMACVVLNSIPIVFIVKSSWQRLQAIEFITMSGYGPLNIRVINSSTVAAYDVLDPRVN